MDLVFMALYEELEFDDWADCGAPVGVAAGGDGGTWLVVVEPAGKQWPLCD